jgi:phenylacetate-CoA ligase
VWDSKHESMPRAQLEQLQLRRLQGKAQKLYQSVPFYRQAMRDRGVAPEDIRSLRDLAKLPFTTKRDFRDNYPFGLLAVPQEEVARMHVSGGTTGKPILAIYTAADLDLWAEMMARTLVSGGVGHSDVVHVAFTYGLFTGGFGFHYGAERIGAAVIPASSGQTKRQILLIQDLGSTAICCTPSYAIFLAETALEMGVDLRDSSLRAGFFGAEPWSERMRDEIESKLGIRALDTYGLSEVLGPGISAECDRRGGLHLYEDHFLPEIVDPESGRPLPSGEKGELVLTPLTKEALPVLRYRTGDITGLDPEPCRCGRTLIRMAKVTGRTDDMLIVRGINVFPSQIESILLRFEGIEPYYQIVVDRERSLDDLEIRVEVSKAIFAELSDEMRRLESFERKIRSEVESMLGISARVRLLEPGSLERSESKARRVVDRREL